MASCWQRRAARRTSPASSRPTRRCRSSPCRSSSAPSAASTRCFPAVQMPGGVPIASGRHRRRAQRGLLRGRDPLVARPRARGAPRGLSRRADEERGGSRPSRPKEAGPRLNRSVQLDPQGATTILARCQAPFWFRSRRVARPRPFSGVPPSWPRVLVSDALQRARSSPSSVRARASTSTTSPA